MIIRNKETKAYIPVPNKYGNASLDFQTAYKYLCGLSEEKRDTLEIYDRDQNKIITPKNYVENTRYLLYLDSKGINLEDYAMGKIEFNTNVEFLSFVDGYVKEYEKSFQKPVLSNQEDFTDYMKYKVLGDIAYNEALNEIGSGYINSSPKMNRLLDKYDISEESSKEDGALYKRISDRWEQGQKERIVSNYKKEVLNKIPIEYREKYLKILPDENTDSHELYMEINNCKQIVQNIDKIEDLNEPIKFLIKWSENPRFKSNEVLNLEDMEYKTNRAIEDVKLRNIEDSKIYGEEVHSYDKLSFLMIIDDGKDFEIIDERHDLGDFSSFKAYFEETFTDEFKNYVYNLIEENETEDETEEEEM